MAWRVKKEYDKAIADYDEAIRLDPKYAIAFNNRGSAWLIKKEYDKAIADYDEAIRLDPKYVNAALQLAVTKMLLRKPNAAAGFQSVIELQGWKDDRAAYAVILGHLSARQAGKAAGARRFLDDSDGKLTDAWPYPAVRFLKGEIDEAMLLELAVDNDKRTEARCYLGLDHALKGDKAGAVKHLRWVKEHGTPTFFEYLIAVAELDRME
jgi:tetratricopeptide (TPR) repeat protein